MFTRLKANIAQFPRLYVVWLAGCTILIAESFIPRQYAEQVDVIFAFILAVAIYQYVFRSAERTRIVLDMIFRFEGHDVCSYPKHIQEQDYTCDNEQGCLVHDKPEDGTRN